MAKRRSFWDWLITPMIVGPVSTEDIKAMAELEKARNPPDITLVKNIYVTKVRNKHTGKVIDIDPDEYDVIETDIKEVPYYED